MQTQSQLKEINDILLKINNIVSKKDEKMEDIVNNFNQRKITEPLIRFSSLAGKIVHDKMLDPNKYVKIKDVIKDYEFK